VIAIGGIGYLLFFKEWKPRQVCPNCKKLRTAQRIDEELLGIFRKSQRQILGPRPTDISLVDLSFAGSNIKMAPYGKYKIHYKCKNCGYEWELAESRKL
jgi:hypothetical protein